MDLRRPLPVAIALALLIALVAAIYGWRESGRVAQGAKLADRGGSKGASQAQVVTDPGGPIASVRTPAEAAPKTTAALIAVAMTSSDPYAFAVRYRSQREVGSFAAARYLVFECRKAYEMTLVMKEFVPGQPVRAVVNRYPVANDGLSPDVMARRAAAAQEISARCRPFVDDHEIGQPLADDASGVALRETEKRMVTSISTPEDIERQMRTFAEQGVLWQYWYALSSQDAGYGYFDGELNGGLSESDFKGAMELAAILATTQGEGGREDLRSLAACVYSARCDGVMAQLVAMEKPSDPALLSRVRPIALRIAEALRSGDAERFRRKP